MILAALTQSQWVGAGLLGLGGLFAAVKYVPWWNIPLPFKSSKATEPIDELDAVTMHVRELIRAGHAKGSQAMVDDATAFLKKYCEVPQKVVAK